MVVGFAGVNPPAPPGSSGRRLAPARADGRAGHSVHTLGDKGAMPNMTTLFDEHVRLKYECIDRLSPSGDLSRLQHPPSRRAGPPCKEKVAVP